MSALKTIMSNAFSNMNDILEVETDKEPHALCLESAGFDVDDISRDEVKDLGRMMMKILTMAALALPADEVMYLAGCIMTDMFTAGYGEGKKVAALEAIPTSDNEAS